MADRGVFFPGRDFADLMQRTIGQWGDATFPQATPQSIINHMKREVVELEKALVTKDPAKIAGEIGDVFHLLIHVAHKTGLSIHAVTTDKFNINRGRSWGTPDKDGVVEHVRNRDGSDPSKISAGVPL